MFYTHHRSIQEGMGVLSPQMCETNIQSPWLPSLNIQMLKVSCERSQNSVLPVSQVYSSLVTVRKLLSEASWMENFAHHRSHKCFSFCQNVLL